MTSLYEALRPPATAAKEWPVIYYVGMGLEKGLVGSYKIAAPYAPHSIAFFCATCGNLWARIQVGTYDTVWHVETVPCRNHTPAGVSDWARWPGSILHSPGLVSTKISMMWWAVALDLIPLPLLQREFNLALTEAERRYGRLNEGPCGAEDIPPGAGGDGEVLLHRNPDGLG